MESAVRLEFSKSSFSFQGEAALAKCARLAEAFCLDPIELSENFEVFAIQRNLSMKCLDDQVVDSFSAFLEKVKGKENQIKKRCSNMDVDNTGASISMLGSPILGDIMSTTPKRRKSNNGVPPSETALSPYVAQSPFYQERQQKGDVVLTLEPQSLNVPEMSSIPGDRPREIKLLSNSLPINRPYGGDTINDKVRVLEARMLDFLSRLQESTSIDAAEPVGIPSQDPVWVVGRICCDADGHLNEKSLVVEGTLKYSGGSRVKLDVSRMKEFSLFPGQVVAIHGVNPTGSNLVALAIIGHLPQIFRNPCKESTGSSKVLVASGPFTTTDDFSFSPLRDFADICKKESPTVVVLLGPFIDCEHPLLNSLDISFDDLYTDQVLPIISDIGNYCQTVVGVPSIRDATCFPVFPHPPLLPLPHGCSSASNPCSFHLEGCTFSATSQDSLKHMSMTTLERVPRSTDRMKRLWQHILGQGRIYPVFPAPLGACLDTSLVSLFDFSHSPDVLIVASDLNPCAKSVDVPFPFYENNQLSIQLSSQKVVCINPGRLAKGRGGGTFAIINVAGSNGAMTGVADRCKVSIRRI